MSPSARLRHENEEKWQACVVHPFCQKLGKGSLPEATMVGYLVQDYTFIDGFFRLAASTIARAPSIDDARPLAQFLALVTSEENTYFKRSFEALGVDSGQPTPALWPVTEAFQALMRDATRSGSYGCMLAVLVVAEWIYLSWANEHHPADDALPFYFSEWISLHAGDGFESVVAYLRAQFDACWPTLDSAEQQQVEAYFHRAVELELEFFTTAYESGART